MKYIISALALISAISVAKCKPATENDQDDNLLDDRTVHFFVLMVPESSVQALRKARQEEEAGTAVTETGAYVGQIISGILGGDVRPIFAGSASFIDEPDVQQGVGTILANVAPSVNTILRMWFTRVQTALGLNTTLKPGTVLANGTVVGPNGMAVAPSNGVVLGQPGLQAQQGQPQQLSQQQQLQNLQNLSPQQQQQLLAILEQQQNIQQLQQQVIAASNGMAALPGSDLFDGTTTIEPLPFLKLKENEDNEESSKLL